MAVDPVFSAAWHRWLPKLRWASAHVDLTLAYAFANATRGREHVSLPPSTGVAPPTRRLNVASTDPEASTNSGGTTS